ncbi:MAG: hypothetical protein R3B13_00140 [Polyangiaceae bacterium]
MIRHRYAAILLLAPFVLHAPSALGQAKECIANHASAKEKRKGGALMAAKDEFLLCARDTCPKVVREECRELVSKLAGEIPSVVLAVKDERGNDVVDGTVSLDGKEVDGWLGGRGVDVDPGPHTLRFVSADGRESELKFVARAGEKNRSVVIKLISNEPSGPTAGPSSGPGPAPVVEDDKTSSGPPTLAYVLTGVAAVALGSFVYFALDGTSKKSDIDECKPNCTQGDVDAMRRSFLIGDISLGVGAVALGGAAYLFLSPNQPQEPTGVDVSAGPQFMLRASGRF